MIRRSIPVVIAVAALFAGGCSDPKLERSEFVQTLAESEPPVDEAIGNCAYDEIALDEELLQDLTDNGVRSEDISVETSKKLERIVARCILDENEADLEDESEDQ